MNSAFIIRKALCKAESRPPTAASSRPSSAKKTSRASTPGSTFLKERCSSAHSYQCHSHFPCSISLPLYDAFTALDLSGNSLGLGVAVCRLKFAGDEGAAEIAALLSQNKSLTMLDLRYNNLGPKGIKCCGAQNL